MQVCGTTNSKDGFVWTALVDLVLGCGLVIFVVNVFPFDLYVNLVF